MTAPVQEPTADRAVGGAYWATSQLARRPPPPVTATAELMSWARIHRLSSSDQSIPDSTITNVNLDTYDDDGTGTFSSVTYSSAHAIRIMVDGVYSAHARVVLPTTAAQKTDWHIAINFIDPDEYAPYAVIHSSNASFADDMFDVTVSVPAFRATAAANHRLYLTVQQFSGGALPLDGTGGCFLEVVRIGAATSYTSNRGGP